MQCLSTQLLLSHSQPPNKPPIKGIFLTPINLFLRASSKGMPSSKALTPVHRSPPDSLRGHTKPQLAEAIAAVAPKSCLGHPLAHALDVKPARCTLVAEHLGGEP